MNSSEKLKEECAIRKAGRLIANDNFKKVKSSSDRNEHKTGKCKYYNKKVFKGGECEKMINVRKVVGGDDCGWLLKTPCFAEHKTSIQCCFFKLST